MPDKRVFTSSVCLLDMPDQHRTTVAENINPGFFTGIDPAMPIFGALVSEHRATLHLAVT
ncbi:hypothetical protein D3C84_1150790 [compost metagenome]